MPRRNDYESDKDSESSVGTDSDVEYELDADESRDLASRLRLSERAVKDVFRKQRGVCRVTGMPFGEGTYALTAAPRCTRKPMDDDNVVFVLRALESMRQSVDMPWRPFVNLLQAMASEAEM